MNRPESGSEDETTIHVRAACRGEGPSREWIIARFTPLLLAQARYRMAPRVRAHVEPEDLVNEAWLVALSRLDRLEARAGRLTPVLLRFLSTTLLQIYNNLARRAALHKEVRLDRQEDDEMRLDLAAETSGIVTRCARREVESEVLDAIDALAEDEREILVLRGIEQITNGGAASLLGIKPSAAAMRYKRALEKLRARVSGGLLHELAG